MAEIDNITFKLKYNYGDLKAGSSYDLIDLLNEIDRLESERNELEEKYEELKDKYESLQEDLEENYRPIPVAEQYGVSDKDFI